MSDAELVGFLEAAGRSLSEAQGALTGQAGFDSTLAISDAKLEVKATLRSTAEGLKLSTVSSQDARQGAIQPGALSTVKVHFVALAGPQAASSSSTAPNLTADQVAAQVRCRRDMVQLENAFGSVVIDPVFVPKHRRWMVIVTDPADRVSRELVVADTAEAS